MHPQRQHEGFGIPDLSRKSAELVARSFDLGSGSRRETIDCSKAPCCCSAIGSHADEPTDWLRSGQALERVLLTAADLGLQASFPELAAALRSPAVSYPRPGSRCVRSTGLAARGGCPWKPCRLWFGVP